ncbi:MAG TPA: GNAT family N-acetyltransferase [Terriglobales bacterium]
MIGNQMPGRQAPLKEAVALRPGSVQDVDFAFRLYRDTMRDSAAYILWNDAKQEANLAEQLKASDVSIISFHDSDVGWLALEENERSLFLGHFYIQSRFQRRGIGTELLGRLLDGAAAKRKSVELAVLNNNPARGLCERVGRCRRRRCHEIFHEAI